MRAWTTVRIVAEGLGVLLISEPGLREANIGEAEGLFWPEVKSRFGETLTERWFTDDDAAFPGGETAFETRSRPCRTAPVCRRAALSEDRGVDPRCDGAAADKACLAARQPPPGRAIRCYVYCDIRSSPSGSPSSKTEGPVDRQYR